MATTPGDGTPSVPAFPVLTPAHYRLAAGVVGAGLVMLSTPAPTGAPVVDLALGAALGAVTAWCGIRARRWTLLWLAAVAGFAAGGVVLALAIPALALVALDARDPHPAYGPFSAALSAGALTFADVRGPAVVGLVIGVAALAPVAFTALRAAERRQRRVAVAAAAAAVVYAFAASAVAGVAALTAAGRVDSSLDLAQRGIDASRSGDDQSAADALSRAVDELDAAWSRPIRLATLPARAVPVVGWHVRSVADALDGSRAVAAAGATVATDVDLEAIAAPGGGVDLELVRRIAPMLQDLSVAIENARTGLGADRSPWLVPPLAGRLDQLRTVLDRAASGADLAARGTQLLPGLMGASEPRTWLVLLTTPAESRGFGGLVGSWAELETSGGRFRMVRVGRADEINQKLLSQPVPLVEETEYFERYGEFLPEIHFQDLTYSPDFPTDARVATTLYERATGTRADGVILLDPVSMAALLRLAGPVTIDGYPGQLGADAATDFFLRGQYGAYATETDREDALAATATAVVERLGTTRLPSPLTIADVLGPVARERHLAVWSPSSREAALWEGLRVSGAFTVTPGEDVLSVVAQNAANNKSDPYLVRTVTYDVEPDPGTGRVKGTVKVEIRNTTPTSGLPDAVTGSNDRGYPAGTSVIYLSVYTGLPVTAARLDGAKVGWVSRNELGAIVGNTVPNVFIESGRTRVLELDVEGELPSLASGTYRLNVLPQTVVGTSRLEILISGQRMDAADGVVSVEGSQPRTVVYPTESE